MPNEYVKKQRTKNTLVKNIIYITPFTTKPNPSSSSAHQDELHCVWKTIAGVEQSLKHLWLRFTVFDAQLLAEQVGKKYCFVC